MERLIEAYKGIFTEAANGGGELAKTANLALENVDWLQNPTKPVAISNPVLESHLQAVCANSGPEHSPTYKIAQALLAVADQLSWRMKENTGGVDPDLDVFSPKYTSNTIIGEQGLLFSDKVSAGFSLQGPDAYYPAHAHFAEESYWIIGGNGDWRVDAKPWFAVEQGDGIYHPPCARHVMQTNHQAMLTIWLWTSHLNSEVIMV